NVLSHFSGISNSVAIIIVGVVVTVYSAMGGIRAVTFTDILQSFTFCLALPMVGLMIWSHLYSGSFDLSLALSEPKFDISKVLSFHNPSSLEMIPLFLYFIIPAMYPADFQRVAMGSSISQAKKAWAISACIVLVIKIVISWIPFLIFSVNPNLEKQQLLGFVLDNYAYGWMRILLILGIMAMAMSTADSKMNSSAVLFSNDLCKPFGMDEKYELRAATWFSFVVGAFSIALAITTKDLLDMILFANAFYVPIVFPSLCLMIFGVRIAKAPVLIGMAAGLTFVVIWKYLAISTDPIVFATLVNLVFMLTSHYLLGIGKNLSSLDNGDLLESKKT
ncbi:hypothetical protein OAP56_02890, partial [Rickettsiaceae bacterium]|nr:hypothetical protein [Rickettsiaceae bacterium]